MSKIVKRINHRVIVEPWSYGKYDEKWVQGKCESIMSDIKRHVDDIGQVWIESDVEATCSHCGYSWEVSQDDSDPDFPKGTPLCCQKAIDEFSEQKAKA